MVTTPRILATRRRSEAFAATSGAADNDDALVTNAANLQGHHEWVVVRWQAPGLG